MTRRRLPVVAFAAFAAVLACLLPAPAAQAASPESLLVAPDGSSPFDPGEGWRLEPVQVERGRLVFPFRHDDGHRLDLVLLRRGEAREAFHRTRSFDVFHRGRLTDPAERVLLEAVLAALERGDRGQLELARRRPALGEARPRMSLPAQITWMIPLDRVQVAVAALLLLAFGALLPWVGRETFRALADQPPWARRLTAAAIGAGALARILAPAQLVMIFMGYRFATEVAAFTAVPKYGAGTFVLYRLFFEVLGPSHHTLVAVNTAFGIATVPVALALFRRLDPGRHAVPIAAFLLALVPLLVKDHVTESILVPILFWTWCGLLAFDVFLERRGRLALAAAAAGLALAMISRPEMLLVAPMLMGILAWHRGALCRGSALLSPAFLGAAATVTVLLVPHLVHTAGAIRAEGGGDGLPNLGPRLIVDLPFRLVDTNALLSPTLYPAVLTGLALVGLVVFRGAARRLTAALFAAGCLWIGIYYVDLPPASIPRLHAPAGWITTLVAAAVAAALVRRFEGPGALRHPGTLSAALLVLVALTALPSIPRLWQPTNDDAEDAFFLEAVARLPDAPVCFVRIGDPDDPPKRKTHRYHPDYLLQPPHRDDLVLGIRQFEREGHLKCDGPVYFFQGVRCYAMYERTLLAPDAPSMVAACARLRETRHLEPILERTVENRGSLSFDYYPDVPALDLGLYRVGDPTEETAGR